MWITLHLGRDCRCGPHTPSIYCTAYMYIHITVQLTQQYIVLLAIHTAARIIAYSTWLRDGCGVKRGQWGMLKRSREVLF